MPIENCRVLTGRIIETAIRVHRKLGPGLLESVYETCLAHALERRGLEIERQVTRAIEFEGLVVPGAFRLDLVVSRQVIVELKTVERLTDVHRAQTLSYLRFTGLPVALLMNFRAATLRQGLVRFALSR